MVYDPVFLELLGADFESDFVLLEVDSDRYGQSGFGTGAFKKFFDLLVVYERMPAGRSMHLGEKAVFNGVPFGAVGRIVAYDNALLEFLCQVEQLLFECEMAITVGPPAVAKQEDMIGLWVLMDALFVPPPAQVVDDKGRAFVGVADRDEPTVPFDIENAVRDDLALGQVGVLVIPAFGAFFAKQGAAPVKKPQNFFLFGVDAQYRVVFHLHEYAAHQIQNPELFFPVRAFARGQFPRQTAFFVAFRP